MAEVTGLRNSALPYPVYGAPFGVALALLDADGDLVTGAAGLDSEVSLNGNTFADCTNEATEIATSSGIYYLLLTAAEMTADVVSVIVKTSTSGAKSTVLTFYPRKLVSLRSGTSQGGAAGYITLDANASAVDDAYNGMLCVATIDGNVEARIITDYTGSSKQAAVTPNWNVAPDADDTFIIYLPEGVQFNQANVTHVNGTPQTAGDLAALLGTIAGYIDTEVATLVSELAKVPKSDSTVSWNATALAAIAAALLDLANGVETGLTPRQALRLIAAATAAKLSGATTTTIVIRNAVADAKDRITATVDADGNRTAITYDLT